MDETEYGRIVEKYGDIVWRVAISYAKSPQDADDVVQAAFLKLLLRKKPFQGEEHLRRWLIRVTVNECNSLWSSFWRRHVVSMEEKTAAEPAYEFDCQEYRELYEAIAKLPKNYRIVIHLFYYEGYSGREIARLLHITEAAVRTRLVRARAQLKQLLEE